jgi:hypothetical protein
MQNFSRAKIKLIPEISKTQSNAAQSFIGAIIKQIETQPPKQDAVQNRT